MAKGFDKGRTRRGSDMQFVPSPDSVLAQKLGEVVSDLYMSTDESDIRRLWTSAHRLLLKSKADPTRIEAVMKTRRAGALATLVKELEQASKGGLRPSQALVSNIPMAKPQLTPQPPAGLSGEAPPIAAPAPIQSGPSAEQLKSAMKAFRKRLKLTRLDDESRLGNRAMTGGRQSQIVAILAPREYPPAVWEELVKQGKLKDAGSGFYELVGD
jgi:hypothetical protein